MTLPEKLHHIRVKLLECFDLDLPDPDQLTHSGSLTVRGQSFTTLSSISLEELSRGNSFTVYLHAEGEADEKIYYFNFDSRREVSAVQIKLEKVEGSLRQSVQFSSLPREIFVQMVERRMGRAGPRQRPNRGGFMGRRSRPRPQPMSVEEPSDSD